MPEDADSSVTILQRIKCWLNEDGHDWGDWYYGYPSPSEVYQYSTCETCGKKRANKIVGRDETPSATERRRRER